MPLGTGAANLRWKWHSAPARRQFEQTEVSSAEAGSPNLGQEDKTIRFQSTAAKERLNKHVDFSIVPVPTGSNSCDVFNHIGMPQTQPEYPTTIILERPFGMQSCVPLVSWEVCQMVAHISTRRFRSSFPCIHPVLRSSNGFMMTSIITIGALNNTSGVRDAKVAGPSCSQHQKASMPLHARLQNMLWTVWKTQRLSQLLFWTRQLGSFRFLHLSPTTMSSAGRFSLSLLVWKWWKIGIRSIATCCWWLVKWLRVPHLCMNLPRFICGYLNCGLHVGRSMPMYHIANGIKSRPLLQLTYTEARSHFLRLAFQIGDGLPILSKQMLRLDLAVGHERICWTWPTTMCKRFWTYSPHLRAEQLGHSSWVWGLSTASKKVKIMWLPMDFGPSRSWACGTVFMQVWGQVRF